MSFLPPSSVKSSVARTQSQIAASNLVAIINRINDARAQESVSPTWLRDQVNEFSVALDSYIVAGGDPVELLGSIYFSRSLSDATVVLLGSGFHLKPFVDMDYFCMTMKEVVTHISAITDTLGHSAFGDNLDCRWHGFIVSHVCQSIFGEF